MLFKHIFDYKKLERQTDPQTGKRHYLCPETNDLIPSITTILSATSDKQEHIEQWKQRVGAKRAAKEILYAQNLGTMVHDSLEAYILNKERRSGNHPLRILSSKMADNIINNSIRKISEVNGIEVGLYYPGLLAGTTDMVCVFDGKLSIADHKTAKEIRSKEMIEDYFLQMSAYRMCHNHVYGTNIQRAVIFMTSRNLDYKEFMIEDAELDRYEDLFLKRVEKYISNL